MYNPLKMVVFWRSRFLRFWVLLGVAVALGFTNLALVSFVISIWLIGQHIATPTWSKSASIVLSYVCICIGVIVLYDLAWLAQIKLNFSATLWLIIVAAICLELFHQRTSSAASGHQALPWLSLIAAGVICIFVSLPVLRHPTSANVLRYAAKTGDDINHMSIIETERSIGGYFYVSKDDLSAYANPAMNGYPQGWHINGAFVESLIVKLAGTDNATTRVVSFFVYKTLWLGIAVFLVCELMYSFARRIAGKLPAYLSILIALSGVSLSGYFLVAVYGYGFQSFVAAIVFLCAGLLLLINYTFSSVNKKASLVALAATGLASSSVWILTAPMLLLPAAYILFKELRLKRPYFPNLTLHAATCAVILMLLSLTPVYAQVKFGGGGNIDVDGATPPIWWLAVLAIWVAWFVLSALRPHKNFRQILGCVGLVFVEFFGFALYQQVKLGAQHYYSIKLTYLAAIVGLALLLPLLFKYLSAWSRRSFLTYTLATVAVMLLPLFVGVDIHKSAYPLKDSAPIGAATATAILEHGAAGRNIVVLTNDPSESYLATKTAADLWVYGNASEKAAIDTLLRSVTAPTVWNNVRSQANFGPGIMVIHP